ncbi:hypothetical protein F0562_006274 [Nyssa sinensis]|uniref:Uncharacterized protein n=1 Tax=Nyssa sinensis TaxID=561372 RepID=A0A5J5AKH0_9ASTE|nr:hypothetical protein F0562_006274 [Nyssa sinensis]
MSISNGIVLPFIILLVSTSVFIQKPVVFGSPLQEQSFSRPDPLRRFKLYKGGYDIRNKHYWASAAFTGIHGYAIAGVWMLCGLGFGSYLIFKNCSGSSSLVANNSDSSYHILFSLVVLFSLLAIVASSLVTAANQSSQKRTKRVEETILGAGVGARGTIQKVTKAIVQMQNLLCPYDPITCQLLNSTADRLRRESQIIHYFVQKNRHSFDQAIQSSYIANLVVVTVNLVLLVAALVLLLLHWHPGFFIIIFFCWILTTLCWVLTGFDFFFHNFAEDTCSALDGFEQNPQNNSLSSLIPCVNSSNKILVKIGYTVHTFITKLNAKIKELHQLLGLDEQLEEFIDVQKICDPFSGPPNYSYTPEKCPKDAIPIGDLPNVISRFTCYNENSPEKCEGDGRFLPEASYVMVWAYSRSIQDLINIFPDVQSLIECSSVKAAITEVVLHQCKSFRAQSRLLWASMLSLSIIMVVLVLLWVAKAYQDRGRCFNMCSIIPRPT